MHAMEFSTNVEKPPAGHVTKAIKMYTLAAEAGDAEANVILGEMLGEGYGVPKDVKRVVECCARAAMAENAEERRQTLVTLESPSPVGTSCGNMLK